MASMLRGLHSIRFPTEHFEEIKKVLKSQGMTNEIYLVNGGLDTIAIVQLNPDVEIFLKLKYKDILITPL